jgi:ATP-binding cassette subfamily F protein uup
VNFGGTLLLISHDRAFLDNVVTSTWAFEGGGIVREYVGGHADWLRQRPAAGTAPATAPARPQAAAPAAAGDGQGGRRKLSYKEQRELDALPGKIAALEAEQAGLQAALADPGYFVRAPQEAAAAAQRLGSIDDELLDLLERWEALEG